jgi:multicomponent K+:H+ antiporter subunit E
MTRLLPYPLLAASLFIMWLLLNGLSAGHVLLGIIVALVASRLMAALEPAKPRLRRWRQIPQLVFRVAVDIVLSNIAVALLILLGRRGRGAAGFVVIPLKLRDRMALAILACIISSTPGTAWVEYHPGSGRLRIHVLDLADEQHWIELIQGRYESLLLEIFE